MANFIKVFILHLLLAFKLSFAQTNLVPNFSFEQYDTCPSFGDQIQYAVGWSKYCNINYTPDYYNACSSSSAMGVPNNAISYQPDHRNCNGYAGTVTFDISTQNYREYFGIQLTQPLTIGQKYFISFYTVMGSEKAIVGNFYEMPSNNIGARLSTVTYSPANPSPVNNWAHVNYSSVLNDSINWTRVSGSLIADSAYNYLTIGNFFDDANTTTQNYSCGNCLNNYSYYLIDDVCVSTDSLLCNGGTDTIPCLTSMNELLFEGEIKVFPNPVTDFLNIQFVKDVDNVIELYDILGNRTYLKANNDEKNTRINFSSLPSGTYFLKIFQSHNEHIIVKRIIRL